MLLADVQFFKYFFMFLVSVCLSKPNPIHMRGLSEGLYSFSSQNNSNMEVEKPGRHCLLLIFESFYKISLIKIPSQLLIAKNVSYYDNHNRQWISTELNKTDANTYAVHMDQNTITSVKLDIEFASGNSFDTTHWEIYGCNHWRIQGGAPPVLAPPQGSRFFRFDIHIFRNIAASGVGAPPPPPRGRRPPTGNPGSATGKISEKLKKILIFTELTVSPVGESKNQRWTFTSLR